MLTATPNKQQPQLRARCSVLWALASVLAIAAESQAQQKSLVIGIDGLGYGVQGLAATNTPWIDSLIDGTFGNGNYQGAYSDVAIAGGIIGTASEQPTVSGPGWSSILTGVWTDKHNVRDNSFSGRRYADYPTYLATLKDARPELTTASFVNWDPIDTFIIRSANNDQSLTNDVDFRGTFANDPAVASRAASFLSGNGAFDPDAVFVAFDEVDGAGHSCGSSGQCYGREIGEVDSLVGQLLNSVTARPNFDAEDWQIIITADHGHRPSGGHGGQWHVERTIPFIVASKSLYQGSLPLVPPVAQLDVPPTVLDHFDIEIPDRYVGFSRASGGVSITPDLNGDGIVFGDGTGLAEFDDVTTFVEWWLQPNTLESPNPADLNLDGIANRADWILLNRSNPTMGQAILSEIENVPELSGYQMLLFALVVSVWFRHNG